MTHTGTIRSLVALISFVAIIWMPRADKELVCRFRVCNMQWPSSESSVQVSVRMRIQKCERILFVLVTVSVV